jgi:flagellar hook-associated protein 3 FlgL
MTMTSIGDLARGLMLRSHGARLKQMQAVLTAELASGQVADVAARLGGDLSHLSDIDRSLRRLEGYSVAMGEARLMAGSTQAGLATVQDATSELGAALLSISGTSPTALREHAATQARSVLSVVVGALNTRAAGRSLFAGVATDRAALAPAGTILAELKAAVAGAGDATAIAAAAAAWFDDPAGFGASVYGGSDRSLAPVRIGEGTEVAPTLRADDPVFRDTLRHVALAALATDPDLGLDGAGQALLLRGAGDGLLAGDERITGLRAALGFTEARIEEAETRNAAARTGLDYARGELLAADPYDTATRLQEVQFRLESLYSVTVRASRLSLTEFMR